MHSALPCLKTQTLRNPAVNGGAIRPRSLAVCTDAERPGTDGGRPRPTGNAEVDGRVREVPVSGRCRGNEHRGPGALLPTSPRRAITPSSACAALPPLPHLSPHPPPATPPPTPP